MLAADLKKPVLMIHQTTIPHLDLVERILLNELIKQGRAEIIQSDGVKA